MVPQPFGTGYDVGASNSRTVDCHQFCSFDAYGQVSVPQGQQPLLDLLKCCHEQSSGHPCVNGRPASYFTILLSFVKCDNYNYLGVCRVANLSAPTRLAPRRCKRRLGRGKVYNGAQPINQPSTEIHGFMAMGIKGVMDSIGPSFERATGYRLVLSFGTSKSLSKRLTEGEIADLVVATPSILESLIAAGLVVPGSVVPLVRSGIGIAVRKGAPKPDISTPEAFKHALLAARAIGHPDPAGGGASGVYFSKLIERLGIADAIKPKCRLAPTGTHSADLLVTGEVDLALQQIPELARVEGAELVGPLPDDLQEITVFAGAIHTKAMAPAAAQALLDYLRSPEAIATIKTQRMEPA